MRRHRSLPGLCCALAITSGSLAASTNNSPATTYKWVDDQGITHYGDSVPNDALQKARSVLNNRGVEIQRIEGRKSAADQATADARQASDEQRRQHDQFLISTYGSVKDIETLRDERLDQIDGQIKAATLYIDSLDTRLHALQDRALNFKPYNSRPEARRLPDDLAEDLVRAASERRSQSSALEQRQQELLSVRSQFDSDISRYRELAARNTR
ncbi:MAG: DUF4124 domain-containing protein [Steroidobacteraceae bacterium]